MSNPKGVLAGKLPTELWREMPVKDVMSSPVVTAHIGETAMEVAEKMAASKVGSVVIVKEGRPIGIVTDGDLIAKVLARGVRPNAVIAQEIMSRPLRTVEYDDGITEAARRMRNHGMKRLGVMRMGELAGVISASDIASIAPDLLTLLSEEIRAAEGEILPQTKLYSGHCDRCEKWSYELTEIDAGYLCEECQGEAIA